LVCSSSPSSGVDKPETLGQPVEQVTAQAARVLVYVVQPPLGSVAGLVDPVKVVQETDRRVDVLAHRSSVQLVTFTLDSGAGGLDPEQVESREQQLGVVTLRVLVPMSLTAEVTGV
jgi:hypothetical protein